MNRAISYLRGIKCNFKMKKVKIDPSEISNLKLWKCSFGIQRSIDRFIIWKHAIKWKEYAEVLIKDKIAYINGFSNRKKRRKIEVMFNVVDNFQIMIKMKAGRIYDIFNRDNLGLLIRKAVRKKRLSKDIYYYKEEAMEIYLEKISKSWKTRRKKPSVKLVKISISSLNVKEFNKKRNENNLWKRNLKKEKMSSKLNRYSMEVENMKLGKFNLRKEIVEHEYRTFLMKNGQQLSLNELEIGVLGKGFGARFSEGEREDSKCSVFTTESEGVSQHGQGYVILLKNNNQNAHGEGIC
jgi:hypothetical protein